MLSSSLNTAFQGSIDEMKAEAETMIATAKAEGEEIKRKGAEQVCIHKNSFLLLRIINCSSWCVS